MANVVVKRWRRVETKRRRRRWWERFVFATIASYQLFFFLIFCCWIWMEGAMVEFMKIR
jgi:hypothetical protein